MKFHQIKSNNLYQQMMRIKIKRILLQKSTREETNDLTQEDKTSTDTNQLQETQSVAKENEKDLGANANNEQQDKKMTASQPSENQAIETQTASNDNESQQKVSK